MNTFLKSCCWIQNQAPATPLGKASSSYWIRNSLDLKMKYLLYHQVLSCKRTAGALIKQIYTVLVGKGYGQINRQHWGYWFPFKIPLKGRSQGCKDTRLQGVFLGQSTTTGCSSRCRMNTRTTAWKRWYKMCFEIKCAPNVFWNKTVLLNITTRLAYK